MNCLTREPWMGLITYNQSHMYSPSYSACVSALCNNSLGTYICTSVHTYTRMHAVTHLYMPVFRQQQQQQLDTAATTTAIKHTAPPVPITAINHGSSTEELLPLSTGHSGEVAESASGSQEVSNCASIPRMTIVGPIRAQLLKAA